MSAELIIKNYCKEEGIPVLDVHMIGKTSDDVVTMMRRLQAENKICILFFDFNKTSSEIKKKVSKTNNNILLFERYLWYNNNMIFKSQ